MHAYINIVYYIIIYKLVYYVYIIYMYHWNEATLFRHFGWVVTSKMIDDIFASTYFQ